MEELNERDNAVLNCIFNPSLPLDEYETTVEATDIENLTKEKETTISMEIQAINLAEKGDLDEALQIINNALEIAPERPSLYNNRAHILQYLRQFEEALQDLTKAIELCSENHNKTKSLAHCQRGILYRRFDKSNLAKLDFEISAKLGNTFAKRQLVELNPYAALCNQMLRQVMNKLK